MVSNRPIHLDLDMPGAAGFDQQQAGLGRSPGDTPQGRDGLEQQAQQLRELLETGRRGADAALPGAAAGASATPGGPFALFGAPAGPAGASPMPQAPSHAACEPEPAARQLNEQLQHMARRLLVDDGSGGRRAVQIHLEGEQFAGVVLDISHEQGGVQASFTCSQEEPRERLARNAQWLADGLCQSLRQPVCVSVQTDDPEDRCLVQASASP